VHIIKRDSFRVKLFKETSSINFDISASIYVSRSSPLVNNEINFGESQIA
jgi:hypothetical protein